MRGSLRMFQYVSRDQLTRISGVVPPCGEEAHPRPKAAVRIERRVDAPVGDSLNGVTISIIGPPDACTTGMSPAAYEERQFSAAYGELPKKHAP